MSQYFASVPKTTEIAMDNRRRKPHTPPEAESFRPEAGLSAGNESAARNNSLKSRKDVYFNIK